MSKKNKPFMIADQNENEFLKSGFDMLKIDFQMKYHTMMEALKERVTATRISLTFLSAPFLVITALISTGIIDTDKGISFTTIPSYIFIFIAICGFASIVPLWQFIEANSRYLRTIRSINNFRDYYTKVIQPEIASLDWNNSFLETDTNNPKAFNLTNWAGSHIILMALINSTYIGLGVSCSDGKGIATYSLITLFIGSLIFQILLYKNKK